MQTYTLMRLDSVQSFQTYKRGTYATSIKGDGKTAGIAADEACWWEGSSLHVVPTPGIGSWASDVNDGGVIVGYWSSYYPRRAFVSRGGQFTDIAPLLPGVDSWAAAVSNPGSSSLGLVVGSTGAVADWRPFLLDLASDRVTILDLLPGQTEAHATRVNDIGHVAGTSAGPSREHERLFFYANGNLMDAGDEPGFLRGLNNADTACGSRFFDNRYPWRAYRADLSSGTAIYEDLGHSPKAGYNSSHANAINNAGTIVGFSLGPSVSNLPFVYYPDGHPDAGFQDLGPQVQQADGWELHSAAGINDDGWIIGNGEYQGDGRSFVLIPDPVSPALDSDYVLQFVQLFGAVTSGGAGLGLTPGGKLIPIPAPQWRRLSQPERDLHLAAALQALSQAVGGTRAAEHLHAAGLQISQEAIDALRQIG